MDVDPVAVLERLEHLRCGLLAAVHADDRVHPTHLASAANLDHFVALRSADLREVQGELATLGLSSLGRSEAHVLATVDAVIAALRALVAVSGATPAPGRDDLSSGIPGGVPGPSYQEGSDLLDRAAAELLGPPSPERTTRIMVTLPGEAADHGELVDRLVAAGMDVARINCAHDDRQAWAAMAEHVREASRRHDRPVSVLMDLAGPKLRTGEVEPGPAVRRMKPRRDAYGRVISPGEAVLAAAGSPAALHPTHGLPVVPVSDGPVDALRPGDVLRVVDAREAVRRLVVVSAGPAGALVRSDRSVYLVAGLRIERESDDWVVSVAPLQPVAGSLHVDAGDLVELHALPAGDAPDAVLGAPLPGIGCRIGCTLAEAVDALAVGHRVFLDDGAFGGVVESVADGVARVRITSAPPGGGKLRAEKGINLPDTDVPVAALTDKDLADLDAVVELADVVALSFVRTPIDVELLLDRLGALGADHLGLVLKIETVQAFRSLPALLRTAMRRRRVGVMIARGDLAVEAGYERLAELQEEILWLCEAAHLPVIWATEVLDRLARTGRPSRSEITDAAMSERAECVMLNKGPHILDAIRTLDDILRRMEEHQSKKRPLLRPLRSWAIPPVS